MSEKNVARELAKDLGHAAVACMDAHTAPNYLSVTCPVGGEMLGVLILRGSGDPLLQAAAAKGLIDFLQGRMLMTVVAGPDAPEDEK